MITIDDIFTQIFPWMEGISIDLGTILIALVFLSFLILGFDLVMDMLGARINMHQQSKWSDKFYEAAENARAARDTNTRGSSAWLQQDMVYKDFLRRSAKSSVKSWRWD